MHKPDKFHALDNPVRLCCFIIYACTDSDNGRGSGSDSASSVRSRLEHNNEFSCRPLLTHFPYIHTHTQAIVHFYVQTDKVTNEGGRMCVQKKRKENAEHKKCATKRTYINANEKKKRQRGRKAATERTQTGCQQQQRRCVE